MTLETARLLHHWRHHEFGGVRPFFCQIEAVETAIWFTEVAPSDFGYPTLAVAASHAIGGYVQATLKRELPGVADVLVHVEPAST